ncbi:SMG7L protein [Spatholobus suberectus]|nr:SMG7L protein [Spatholobus suberectus]
MTSLEWLRWYRENYKLERANNYVQRTHLNTPVPRNHVNILYHDTYNSLSINNSVTSLVDESSNFHSSYATYSLPVPSAPLLPDNAAWFTDAQPSLSSSLFPDNTEPESGYADWSSTYGPQGYDPRFPVLSSGYPPLGRMTSSERLRWCRKNYKPKRANNYVQRTHLNTPVPGNHVNILYHDTYNRFGQFD